MSDLSRVSCACLAAGTSSRMRGEHKLLRLLNGRPVLEQTLSQLSPFSFAQKLLVLGHHAESFLPMASDFTPVLNAHYQLGLHGSIRAAVEASSGDALLIVLADQPFHLSAGVQEFFARVGPIDSHVLARAWHGSTPGHPVLIGRAHFARILAEPDGDYGCAYLFKENDFTKIELGESVAWDLDTPEQFDLYSGRS